MNGQVVINEFSAANFNTYIDNFGDDSDWIELYNNSNSPVDLTGYYLSDRMTNPDKWTFPAGTIIGANDYLVIWASGKDNGGGELHADFKITQTRTEEAVVFSDPDGNIIDSHELEVPNKTGHSYAKLTDGGSEWGVATSPTFDGPNGTVVNGYASYADIEPSAGFYTGSQMISISTPDADASIYYTTDGSDPDASSTLYSGPFEITQTTAVRAVVISPNAELESFYETNTYILNENHVIPVVSIVGEDIEDLMDGFQFDPVVSIEMFGADGEKWDEAVGECNKHGNDSWAYDQRGIDYITRDQFGYDSDIDHEIFSRKERKEYQRFMLKAGANDNYPFEFGGAHIRDAYVHTISQMANLEMDERTYEPCILYINGRYWGVYEIREKVDDHDYTKEYYDQGKQWIDFIKTWGGTWEEYGSWDEWYDLRDYIENNDMTVPANYEYVDERLNLVSLIDYIVLHSWNVSSDWLNWNTAWWRGRKEDGEAKKWRYALWDEDATFGHYINYSNVPSQDPDADPCDPEEIGEFVDFEGHLGIFAKLFENQDFLELYINRYADLNNTYFSCDFTIPLLDSLIGAIEPEMQQHINRWGGTYDEWQANVQSLKDFLTTRCEIIDQGILDCYEDEGITGPYELVINVEPPGSGRVKANSQIGLSYPWSATYFGGVSIELEGVPNGNNQFWYWEVANNTFGPSDMDKVIEMSLETGDEITAHFIEAIPCQGPTNLLVDSTLTSADLEWTGSFGAVGFNVEYRKNGTTDDWTILSTIDPMLVLPNLEMCTKYDFNVRSVCETALSEYTEFTFETACMVGTNDLANIGIGELNIYPNPFLENFQMNIQPNDAQYVSVSIMDPTGKLIEKYDLGHGQNIQREFNGLSHLASGFYSVRITTDKGVVGFPLMKIK